MKNEIEDNFKGLNTFNHVVVLMLENRSFDNLLGYLFKHKDFKIPPGKSFDGLQDQGLHNPVPARAKGSSENPNIKIHRAQDMSQPFPDPGEVYQHVNTQLYNHVDKENIAIGQAEMKTPYNIPNPLPPVKERMKGFINDYLNTLQGLWYDKLGPQNELSPRKRKKNEKLYAKFQNPDVDQYKVIMQCFEPEQIPVLTKLATNFAVFDHWFCSVPSQTWCNRAFWHAGTSAGKVINPTDEAKGESLDGMASWMANVWPKSTLFDLLEDKNISHALYANPIFSVTHAVHGFSHNMNLVPNVFDLIEFKNDINDCGDRPFPHYSFIEPKFFGKHNDQHPSSVPHGAFANDGKTTEGTVRLGEELIRNVYDIIKNSPHRDDTLLIITHDEHGGCFDHIEPTQAVPPEKGMAGEKGFNFDRLGIRVPMVMVSSHIQENTIVNEVHDHTSFIKTMCKKWTLDGLTDRDKSQLTNTFENIFTPTLRDWPEIPAAEIELIENTEEEYDNHPLNELQRSMMKAATYIANNNRTMSQVKFDPINLDNIDTVKEAKDYMESIKEWLK